MIIDVFLFKNGLNMVKFYVESPNTYPEFSSLAIIAFQN